MDLLCFCSVLCLLCLCARLFICALWSPAGKGLTSWLSFVVPTVSLALSRLYSGSGVVLENLIFGKCEYQNGILIFEIVLKSDLKHDIRKCSECQSRFLTILNNNIENLYSSNIEIEYRKLNYLLKLKLEN